MGRGCLDGFGEQEITADRRGDPSGSTSEGSWGEWGPPLQLMAEVRPVSAEIPTGESGRQRCRGASLAQQVPGGGQPPWAFVSPL